MIKLKTMDKKEQIKEQAREFLKGCEHDGSFIPVNEVIRLMADFHLSHTSELSDEDTLEKLDTLQIAYQSGEIADIGYLINKAYLIGKNTQAPQLTEDKKECCKICGHEVIECDIFCEVCNERRFIKKG